MHKLTKLNSKGFGHVVALLAIAVIVVAAGAGFVVYKHQHKAHAAAYDYIGNSWGMYFYACKTYSPAYGGVWGVKALYTKPTNVQGKYQLEVVRNSRVISNQVGSAWFNNTVASLSTSASIPLHDEVEIFVSLPVGSSGSGQTLSSSRIGNLSNC